MHEWWRTYPASCLRRMGQPGTSGRTPGGDGSACLGVTADVLAHSYRWRGEKRRTDVGINVVLDGSPVPIDPEVFEILFDNSVVASKAGVRHARERGEIKYADLVKLANEAEIPYPLFFAPLAVVREQARMKTQKLMAGFTQRDFSMNSRNEVRLSDIELIVKDLLRKQQFLRLDSTLKTNVVVGCIKRPAATAAEDAALLMERIRLGRHDLRDTRNREKALDLLISRLENEQILVSRSSAGFMPQRLPARAQFSGLTIKDTKVPYIFLASGDEGEHLELEPTGRRVFTLTLLAVLIGRGTFAPVTYDGRTTDETAGRAYDITAEILMPAAEVREARDDLRTLDGVQAVADIWKVTPSAMAVRGRRLGLIDRPRFEDYVAELAARYARRAKPTMRRPLAVRALRRYNGVECSRRMLVLHDSGRINAADFCRVMFSNKLRPRDIGEFRAALR